MKNIPLLLAVALLASSCVSGSRENGVDKDGNLVGNISLSGAFALYPLAVVWADEFKKEHPGVVIDLSAGGAGKGMTDALAGIVDFGMVSREVYPEEKAQGAVAYAVAIDAVVATINAKNPLANEILKHGLTPASARSIWLTQGATTWGDILGNDDETPLHAYTRSDACGAADTWAQWFGAKQEDLGGTAVFGDPGVAKAVQDDIYGIGYNNIGYAYDNETHALNEGLLVVPIDLNADGEISSDEFFYYLKDSLTAAIAEHRYPAPPSRELNLVAKGEPTDTVVKAFLAYVLSAEGQSKNAESGYVAVR